MLETKIKEKIVSDKQKKIKKHKN